MLRDRRFDEEGTAYCFSLSLGTRLYTGSRKIGRGYFHDKNHGFGGSRTPLEYVWDRKRGSSTTVLGIFIRGPRTSVPLELRCRINSSRGEWRVYGKWGNLKLRRSWNFFFFLFEEERCSRLVLILLWKSWKVSFDTYGSFLEKKKSNLKEPSELLTILKIRLFINDIIFRIYLVKFSEREREKFLESWR